MPLFEVDAERPVLVESPPPRSSFGTAAHRVVDGNLDGLLGEQIFPVAQGRSVAEPHLLALDAAGLPVVVDVVAELTEETLIRALNHAGAAGRLTRADLAARYRGGAGSFQQDLASFYDNVPLTRSQGTSRTTGARLIVICRSADPGILDALDFLRQPGSPVAILRLGVVHTDDGRRFVDISPLAMSRRVTRLEESDDGVETFADGVTVGQALSGKVPIVAREANGQSTASPSRAERRRARKALVEHGGTYSGDFDTSPIPPVGEPLASALDSLRTPSGTPEVVPERIGAPLSGSAVPLGHDDDPDLYRLARSLGVPVPLVWSRPRRGQRFDAVLHPDGFIELTDGARYRHPDLAAVAASGTPTADGWSVWRLGEGGPTLTDAFRDRYS